MMVAMQQQDEDSRKRCHAINNRMNAIIVGMSILERHDRADVRDIVQILQRDLDELQALLEQCQPPSA